MYELGQAFDPPTSGKIEPMNSNVDGIRRSRSSSMNNEVMSLSKKHILIILIILALMYYYHFNPA